MPLRHTLLFIELAEMANTVSYFPEVGLDMFNPVSFSLGRSLRSYVNILACFTVGLFVQTYQ